MSPNASIARAYRGLLREVVKSSISLRSSRNRAIHTNLRKALLESIKRKQNHSKVLRDIANTTTFLGANRIYKVLLDRYNPLHDLTEEERVRATARRVGLDTPTEYEP